MRTIRLQRPVSSCVVLLGGLVVIAACGGRSDSSETELNKQVVVRYHEVVASEGRLDLIDEIVAEDYVGHGLPGQTRRGREAFRLTQERLKAAFPDRQDVIDQVLAEGSFVMSRTILTGTHNGQFLGISATGREVKWRQFHIWRIVDGTIAEHWAQRDDLGVLHQIGIVEVPDAVGEILGWESPTSN